MLENINHCRRKTSNMFAYLSSTPVAFSKLGQIDFVMTKYSTFKRPGPKIIYLGCRGLAEETECIETNTYQECHDWSTSMWNKLVTKRTVSLSKSCKTRMKKGNESLVLGNRHGMCKQRLCQTSNCLKPSNSSLVVKVNNDYHETGDGFSGFSGSFNITNE